MSKNNFSFLGQKIHFIGISGISMSGLAKHLRAKGFAVSGSDISNLEQENLQKEGVSFFSKHDEKNLDGASVAVYSSAISDFNVEILSAKEKNIPLISRSKLLGAILNGYENSIGICGSHGKTTATAMIAKIMIEAGKNPTVFLGGHDKEFGNYRQGGEDLAIAEICEFRKNLLDMPTKMSVILNIDNDHLDSYSNMKDMINTFSKYCQDSIIIANADDQYACQVFNSSTVTFGINKLASFMAKEIKNKKEGYSFCAYAYGQKLGRINLKIQGKHNIYNALSAIAISYLNKIPFAKQKSALEKFYGVKRRNEFLGKINDLEIFADYAHHPKEIDATINSCKEKGEQFITIFQPHTYSRTKILMNDFVMSLSSINPLIIVETYSAREDFDQEGSAYNLYLKIKEKAKNEIFFAKNQKGIKEILIKKQKEYKKAIFLGAGDIYEMAKSLIKEFDNS